MLNLVRDRCFAPQETYGIRDTTLKANAAMKSIGRRVGREGWKDYLRKLAAADGNASPTDDDLRRLYRPRPGKQVSEEEW